MATEIVRDDTRAYVTMPEEGQILENLHLRMLATGVQAGGTLCAVECVNPGPGGPPQHTHHASDELYLVLQGRYRFRIGADEWEGGPGTFTYVSRGVSHTFASVGSEEGRLFSVTIPDMGEFLKRMEGLTARDGSY